MRHYLKAARTALLAATLAGPAWAGADNFLGQVMLTGDLFCPRSWADANGQILSIAQNQALFSLFGTTYGGNGVTTFALPDIRSLVVNSVGQGPGLPTYVLGQKGGNASPTLTVQQMPAHSHMLFGTSDAADSGSPANGLFGQITQPPVYDTDGPLDLVLNPGTLGPAGGSQPFDNRQPFLVLRYCVALAGIFPSRN